MRFEIPLDEVKGKPTQPISVGNYNFFDIALHDSFQNGDKSPSLEVDALSYVLNNLVGGEL
jgi:hypothetical protein